MNKLMTDIKVEQGANNRAGMRQWFPKCVCVCVCVCVCLAQNRLGFRRYRAQCCVLFLDLRAQARPQKFCAV